MKRVILTLWFFANCIQFALAREVKIGWDAPKDSVRSWRVWRGIDPIATVSVNSATVTISDAETSLTVTAINEYGESPHSNVLTIPQMIWIQKSSDLLTWENVIQIPYVKPSQFIRIQLPD